MNKGEHFVNAHVWVVSFILYTQNKDTGVKKAESIDEWRHNPVEQRLAYALIKVGGLFSF